MNWTFGAVGLGKASGKKYVHWRWSKCQYMLPAVTHIHTHLIIARLNESSNDGRVILRGAILEETNLAAAVRYTLECLDLFLAS